MNINIYNPYVREELYLMHHGIAGQRWGKRNGPPYPLGESDHSASEKKAGWKKSLDNDGKRSTGHPKSEKTLAKELRFLGEVAGKYSRNDDNAAEISERTVEFTKKIEQKSIDWYEQVPKSQLAKQWIKDRDRAYKKVEDSLGNKMNSLYREMMEARTHDTLYKVTGFENKNTRKIRNARDEVAKQYRDAIGEVKRNYNKKLVDVVLKDLGIPVTDKNRKYILDSQVLFWD